MDEIVHYDFPAAFNRILSNSPPNSQIIYIGHSLGTSLALMYGAAFPAEAHRIMKIFVFMSPAYTLSNMISPYKMGAPMGDRLVVSNCFLIGKIHDQFVVQIYLDLRS